MAELGIDAGRLTFESRSGPLHVARETVGGRERYVLDFPARVAEASGDAGVVDGLAGALGARPSWVGRSADDVLCVFDAGETVRGLDPDFRALAGVEARGVIATARAGESDGCDVVSRFFAPRFGVDEDPVTGSAHCTLIPYWADRLGREELHARQVGPRGGELWCQVIRWAGRPQRVLLAGHAVTVLRGELALPA